MEGVFGKWDWVANGVMFGFYHLHQPWGILSNIVFGWIVAFSAKRFHSNWFPIILHSCKVYSHVSNPGLVLGWREPLLRNRYVAIYESEFTK